MIRKAVWVAKSDKGKVGEYETRKEARKHGTRVYLKYREVKLK